MSKGRPDRTSRLWGGAVSLVVLVAVAEPLAREPRDDGFPLSTYPMFSHRKKTATTIHHVVGFSADGQDARVIPPWLLGTDEVMQAAMTVGRAVERGPQGTKALCEDVAARVAAREGEPWSDLTSLQIRSDRYDAVEYFAGDRKPRRTQVRAHCPILRRAP